MTFYPPKPGRKGIRDYRTSVTADQRNIDFTFEIVAVSGSIGDAPWSASLLSDPSGIRVEPALEAPR